MDQRDILYRRLENRQLSKGYIIVVRVKLLCIMRWYAGQT